MEILLSGVVAFAFCLLVTPFLIKLLMRFNAIDSGGGRKIHRGSVPTMGGLAIFVSVIATIAMFSPAILFTRTVPYVIGAISLMALLGFADDALNLKPNRKLFVMIVGATLVYIASIRIWSLYGFFGIHELPPFVSYLVTVFTIIVIINAYNLIDGIDGLAGGIGATTLFCFALWFMLMGNMFGLVLCLSFTGALLAFLHYNWAPARVFMGDTGSLMIGMTCAICTLIFIQENSLMPANDPLCFKGYVAAGVTFVAYPLYDTLRVFIIRIREHRSPFSADTQHTHHYLLRLGYSHSKVTTIILIVNFAGMIVFWILSYFIHSYYVVPIILLTAFLGAKYLQRVENRNRLVEIEQGNPPKQAQ